MVSKVQVEQKEHVQSSQGATQDEPRSLPNCTGDQHSHLRERHITMILRLYVTAFDYFYHLNIKRYIWP